ncbi:MAG: repeat-like protein, partial [Mucilaginibacter sp.]|nr:repeat-like protein [Mucilaginibacter sp.]
MKIQRGIILLAFIGILVGAACKKDTNSAAVSSSSGTSQSVNTHTDDVPPIDNSISSVNISWDSTAKKVSHTIYFAEYGRVHRISASILLLTYHCGGTTDSWNNIALRRSDDNGSTWSDAQIIMADNIPGYYGFSDPDILVMQNGWLMLAFVGRGNPDDNAHDNVQTRISKDNGTTW